MEDGTYDFSCLFEDISDYLDVADIRIINQETLLGGNELGFSGFPKFNYPEVLMTGITGEKENSEEESQNLRLFSIVYVSDSSGFDIRLGSDIQPVRYHHRVSGHIILYDSGRRVPVQEEL